MDKTLPISTVRAQLADLVREAREGTTVHITISGLPVATLGPYTVSSTSSTTQADVTIAAAPSHREASVEAEIRNQGDEPF